jgi:hypothetical protein
MIAITTSSSISVKPRRFSDFDMERSLSQNVAKSLQAVWDQQRRRMRDESTCSVNPVRPNLSRRAGRVLSLVHGYLIEIRLRVRFGPQTDHSRARERRVFGVEEWFAVEVPDRKPVDSSW